MKDRILNPVEIETATVQIICGSKSGTAFFVVIERDRQVLLTSEHNLTEGEQVKLYVNEIEVDAEVLERIPERDVALLELKSEPVGNIRALPLKSSQIPYNEIWETYGFPALRMSGGRYNGRVSRLNDGTKWDVDLDCEQYNKLERFDGLSGSPLIIEGFVVGVIGYDNTGTLGATSIRSVLEYLNKHNIKAKTPKTYSIPDSIESDISDTTPNDEVLQKNK